MKYYIYSICYPTTEEPFYIGVAKITKHCPMGYRPKKHINEAIRYRDGKITKGANLHKLRTILKILEMDEYPMIKVLEEKLNKEDALRRERENIVAIGRRDMGTGPLTNLTDGGEGSFNMSTEGKNRIADFHRTRPSPLKGKKLGPYDRSRVDKAAEASKAALRDKPRNKKPRGPLSEEHKAKLSVSLKGRPSPMKGRVSPLKGILKGPLSQEQRDRLKKRTPGLKRKSPHTKGKTYIEIHGEEKALELKKLRTEAKKKYWSEKNIPQHD